LNVGITLFATPGADVWSNGIQQNIAFLAQLLLRSPAVEQVFFLNGGDADFLPPNLEFGRLSVPFVRPQDVTHDLDVVIEMGAVLPDTWMRHAYACGVRFVSFGVGHSYNALCEAVVFDGREGIFLTDPSLRVESWVLPQYEGNCAHLMRTLTRRPVISMPHIWSPYFLESRVAASVGAETAFGFAPRRGGAASKSWRVGIFEPNLSVAKNCAIPMLVCEHAYRRSPESIAGMMVMNSFHMKEHPTFLRFALQLELTRQHRATYEPRVQFSDAMMHQKLDAVVSHHSENAQNYLYYDALYGGYPLIHNSPFLREAGQGFYYSEFSPGEGGEALLHAWRQPAEFWQDYRLNAAKYLGTLAPEHPENVRIFTERLLHVAGRAA
jgi:hypothetical protein